MPLTLRSHAPVIASKGYRPPYTELRCNRANSLPGSPLSYSTHLYEAEWKKQPSAGICANVPFLSPVSYHSRKRAFVKISVVCCVSFSCTTIPVPQNNECYSINPHLHKNSPFPQILPTINSFPPTGLISRFLQSFLQIFTHNGFYRFSILC